ncbi:MAG: AAA family ATPase [Gammaproteobacteria bacterium]|nr:AAA family ATPase [Gammaproteobacteria bacterium]
MIKELFIKDVRCFPGEQRIRIRPLTFLVGENSTGKTTALGCFNAMVNIDRAAIQGSRQLDFNLEPYRMGAFWDIARKTEKVTQNECGSFTLGLGLDNPEIGSVEVFFEFEEVGSEPSLTAVKFKFSEEEMIIYELTSASSRNEHHTKDSSAEFHIKKEEGKNIFVVKSTNPGFLFLFDMRLGEEKTASGVRELKELRKFLVKKDPQAGKRTSFPLLHILLNEFEAPISMAPIRSKPQRTYDPLTEARTAEGSDVPMYLMRLKRTGVREEKQVRDSLLDFGKKSGLFTAVNVKTYGEGMNEPFQLQVNVRGVDANILDVGYGVSQLLPILVRIFANRGPRFFLLQQPEVHLHPRGQAELTSLFISSIKEDQHKFIVETHSDYMIKRARIEIRRNRIEPDDVSLVYFKPEGKQVRVHNIDFDESGNLLNAPPDYQQFFLEESDRFLGFKD